MYYKSFEKETVSIRHDTKSDLFHINNNNKFILLGSTKFILKTKNFIVSLIFPTDFSATNKFDAHAEYKTLDQEFSEIISLECNSITDID